jgi:hypothetical protein
MKYTFAGQLPRHLYVWVDTAHTHKEIQPVRFTPAVWFGLTSYPGRMWGLNVMLESGAVYRGLPPHAIAFSDTPDEMDWTQDMAQQWDCYGYEFTTIEYEYLKGLDVTAKCDSGRVLRDGAYLFTAAPIGDGFSAYPEQSKEFSFIRLYNGRLTVQPTNNLLFVEKSFTHNPEGEWPRGLKRQTDVWTCE